MRMRISTHHLRQTKLNSKFTLKMLGYAEIIAAILWFIFIIQWRRRSKTPLLIDWPFVGMLPELLHHLWEIHDFVTMALKRQGGTGEFRGPWFTNMDYLVTSDHMNVHHTMSKNFGNYIKGPVFREIFEAFGEGIFTADSETWKSNRALLHSLFKNKNFELFLEKTIRKKLKNSLFPVLDHVEKQGTEVDLQDVFNRFNFDIICSLILGSDPQCLSIEFPEVKSEKAFNEAEEFIFYRHTVPGSIWKIQKWLQVGQEKKIAEACEVFDQFLHECIASKRKELSTCTQRTTMGEQQVDLLTALINGQEEKDQDDDKFLRDTTFNLFVAGRDTITSALTWFFWLVATHPLVEAKIHEEIKQKLASIDKKDFIFGVEDVKNLAYLHGAICEALRLFPPIPFERKQAIKSDILPSGHHVSPNTVILFFLYSMGRSEEIWGKDCLEFKPERWISEHGSIVHVPSYKFISFNAGPRTCLGKDLSFAQMKMVASEILFNYHVQVVEGHPISPSLSIVLLMKHGLKVKITKRRV